MSDFHTPVLLEEVLEYLQVRRGKKYIDATMGGGGHSLEIVRLGGNVLGIDQDRDAIEAVKLKINPPAGGEKLKVVLGNFRDIEKIARENGFDKVDGILFDLGMSSFQIEGSGKGFSFLKDAPLDMRMNQDEEMTAEKIVNTWTREELSRLFSTLGEEHFADQIAEKITHARKTKKIQMTHELVEIIRQAKPKGKGREKIHPATQVFQALRMAVNKELESLRNGLEGAFELLNAGGRIAVISFHSLEDRVVKQKFKERETRGGFTVITKKPIIAKDDEIEKNRRARSAKLRVLEKQYEKN